MSSAGCKVTTICAHADNSRPEIVPFISNYLFLMAVQTRPT